MALDEYIAANRELTDRLVYATRLPDVRLALTVSGGAAVYPRDARHGPIEDNPYGYLKREAEHRLAGAAAKSGAGPVVARCQSWRGPGASPVPTYRNRTATHWPR